MRRIGPGNPEPLGLTLVPGGANVAVFSANARAIDLCLFDADGARELERITLPERTGDVFHGFVDGIAVGARYGLRAYGPYAPQRGHRFNPAKLLLDPYARAIDRRFAFHAAMACADADGTEPGDADSAPFVPKGIATAAPEPAAGARPHVAWAQTTIYELHVRGFTQLHPDVPAELRGTCAGLAHPAALAHLRRLGVTTVELMPVAAAIDEPHLARLGLANYWGYNPAAWFVPDPRLAPGGIEELRACVAALHQHGIEVLLDIVLNHSGEGDEHGPTFCLRGLDNATYYRTRREDPAAYANDSGCGNTLALERPPVLRLAMDMLRYYAQAAGVDGFRFDLATCLGRLEQGFDPAAPLLAAIAQDPLLRDLKLIAEPWDVGPGGYRAGAFPAAWGEWNDRFRDAARRFWRGDAALAGELATRLAGSSDVFAQRARPPSRSINFVTAHDGFTLADLVAYERKHNEVNGEHNRDGTDANFSWNSGIEGPAGDAQVVARRQRDARALFATLILARGTPMLAMGDELGRTQLGNNNAYGQDNPLSWIDWPRADRELEGFVAALIDARKRHPALRLDRWLAGEPADASGIPDVEWQRIDGAPMSQADWNADTRALAAVLYAPATPDCGADRVVLAINGGSDAVSLIRPDPRKGCAWRRCIDSADLIGATASTRLEPEGPSPLAPRSVVLLVEEQAAARGIEPARAKAAARPEVFSRLAAAAGILPDWWDVAGERHWVSAESQAALLEAMGLGASSTSDARARLAQLAERRERRRLPTALVCEAGSPSTLLMVQGGAAGATRIRLKLSPEDGAASEIRLDLENLPAKAERGIDGRTVVRRVVTLPPLAAGVHSLQVESEPENACTILAAPLRCHLPPEVSRGGRRFGLAAHLYALRRQGDQGIGDFSTLAQAAEATGRAGGSFVGLNPLHALFAGDRTRASPYQPSDRRFLDPLYIDLLRVPDLAHSAEARALLDSHAAQVAALSAAPAVDYPAVWSLKNAVLAACHRAFERRPAGDPLAREYGRFVGDGGATLQRFACFNAIAGSLRGLPWPQWPKELSRPDAPGVAPLAGTRARELRYEFYLQWLAERQLGEAAARASRAGLSLGLYRDLAVGAAPDGAEAWADPGAWARGASIGAPPDPFCRAGQVWGLPPLVPDALAADGYARFRGLVAANMRHAGALRIDHVMGLARLFWVPDGATAGEGAYVQYPFDDLLGALALESTRARCLVVGEDLGTVPAGLRERLALADVMSYRVLWFERDGPEFTAPQRYPAKAAASVSTHDLPTIAGWWAETDLAEKRSLGIVSPQEEGRAREERAAERRALAGALAREDAGASVDPDKPLEDAIIAAIHRYIGASPAALALVQADDLAGETVALNLPGTDRERPNWRRKTGVNAVDLWTTPVGARAAIDLAARNNAKARSDTP